MMHRRGVLLIAGFVIPTAVPVAAQQGAIHGTATYRERMALPPGTVLEVVLQEIGRADAPATRIAEARIPVDHQVPIPFTLTFDPSRLRPGGRYALRATLAREGQVLFRTDQVHPVRPGDPQPIALRLVRDTAAGLAPTAHGFTGSRWVATEIGGEPATPGVVSDITFATDRSAYGAGGCNRIRGAWTATGSDGLSLGDMASTMMACGGAQDRQERRFLDALRAVRRWRIEGDTLALADAGDSILVRLRRG